MANALDRVFSPTTHALPPGPGAVHGIGAPIHIYPLYEVGYRARRHQSLAENHAESARLYAEFAAVAEGNEVAWGYGGGEGKEEGEGKGEGQVQRTGLDVETMERRIREVGRGNRMICSPCEWSPVLVICT